ncbi:MFS transporter [Pseudonocardia sp. RS11V-5]|uniref:MFS transporter n=1 Tax=Pseudonocardia terrae TaxID=2905831 RepID=UPI001E4DDDA0|nr:MFS transporter [Pseudonocardia terrae]MCE3552304.1 MFS transporter [Pseudonocardia terrae]
MNARSASLVLVGLLALSLNLRAALSAYPPLLGEVRGALGIDAGTAGAAQTGAILAMAVGSLIGPRVGARFGAVRALGASVGLVALGSLVRGVPALAPLFIGTLVIGLGIGVAGVLLTAVVKDRLAARAGMASGAYVVAMMLGSTIVSALAVPVAVGLGGWSYSLALWAVPALVAVGVWVAIMRGDTAPRSANATARRRLPWRDPFARLTAMYQSGVSLTVYGSLTWVAPAYVDRGWSPGTAGLLIAVWSVAQMPSALLVPILAERSGHFRRWALLMASGSVVAVLGMVLLPEPPVVGAWLWVALIGIGCGAGFPLGLSVIAHRTPDAAASAATSGLALGVGYTVAGLGPLLMGVLVDLTHGYAAALLVLLGAALLQIVATVGIGDHRREAAAATT